MLLGNIFALRNQALLKMFNLVDVGERAGSGIPNIFNAWEDEGWVEPRIEEQFELDRTMLTLMVGLRMLGTDKETKGKIVNEN